MKNKPERAVKTLLHSGYYVYSAVWEAAIGEELACERITTMHEIVML